MAYPILTPARLHVLLARDAPLGVVIRRGPAKQSCTLLWDLRTDEFTLGQWLKGRIYEERSDLSPDGRHLIYFAYNGGRWRSATGASWTAVSRAPYLKALSLYGVGHTWFGGGLFSRAGHYWLDGGGEPLRESAEVRRDTAFHPGARDGWFNQYHYRLTRDGWRLAAASQSPRTRYQFEKDAPRGWTLVRVAHPGRPPGPGRGRRAVDHFLTRAGVTIPCPGWEWADVDAARDRLAWAAGGRLFAGKLDLGGLHEIAELRDFNPMTFEPIRAPY